MSNYKTGNRDIAQSRVCNLIHDMEHIKKKELQKRGPWLYSFRLVFIS